MKNKYRFGKNSRPRSGFVFSFMVALALKAPLLLAARQEPESPVFKIMESEMNRSLSQLKFEDFNPPYFIAYQLLDGK